MALVLADRVQETTTTTGTGTVTLLGAVSGFQSFAAIGNGNTTYYNISGGTEWEVGIGTYTSAGTTLARTTVLSSSNSGSLVNFSAGTKNVFVTYPAGKSVNLDASGNVALTGRITASAQPAFLAGINSNTDATVTVNTAIAANITQYNVGSGYSTSTYRFTAPTAGVYNFTVGIYFTASASNTQNMQVGFRKNGSFINGGSDVYGTMTMQPSSFAGQVAQISLSAQFLLAANDYVDVAPRTNSLRHYQGHYWFQGNLIC